jgi:hypothetical protein
VVDQQQCKALRVVVVVRGDKGLLINEDGYLVALECGWILDDVFNQIVDIFV